MTESNHVDIRCPTCNRLLFKLRAVPHNGTVLLLKEGPGDVQIKCQRCKEVVELRLAPEYRK